MDREEQTRYGAMLEAAAAELRRLLAGDHESTQPVVPDRAIGRLSRVDDHAGAAEGTYGSCTRCGKDIGQARLDAIPDTFLCVTCVERLQARGSDRNPEP